MIPGGKLYLARRIGSIRVAEERRSEIADIVLVVCVVKNIERVNPYFQLADAGWGTFSASTAQPFLPSSSRVAA